MIHDPIFRAVAEGIGIDPDGPGTNGDLEALIAGQATLRYTLDGNEQLVASIDHLESPCSA
jgi:hypothetical protein